MFTNLSYSLWKLIVCVCAMRLIDCSRSYQMPWTNQITEIAPCTPISGVWCLWMCVVCLMCLFFMVMIIFVCLWRVCDKYITCAHLFRWTWRYVRVFVWWCVCLCGAYLRMYYCLRLLSICIPLSVYNFVLCVCVCAKALCVRFCVFACSCVTVCVLVCECLCACVCVCFCVSVCVCTTQYQSGSYC